MEGADDTCGVTAAGIVVNYASLFVTCIASYRIALFVAPLSIGPISIPRGTGFMLVGMLAAGLRPRMIKCAGATYPVFGGGTADTVDDVELNVYFPINYVCMCFIAYATGSELIVRRYRKLYKKILKVSEGRSSSPSRGRRRRSTSERWRGRCVRAPAAPASHGSCGGSSRTWSPAT